MGTLTDQPPRKHHRIDAEDVTDFIKEAKAIAKNQKVELSDVLEAYRILELKRKNTLYVTNGDIFDEQMAGLGKLIEEFIALQQASAAEQEF